MKKIEQPANFSKQLHARLAPRIFYALAIIATLIALMDLSFVWNEGISYPPLRRAFNVTREDGIGNWFSVLLWFILALVTAFIAAERSTDTPKWPSRGWQAFALFFLFLSLDDGSKLHERIGSAFREWITNTSGDQAGVPGVLQLFPSYYWHVVFVPIYGAVFFAYSVFVWRELLTQSSRSVLVLALSIMVLSQGLDFIEGLTMFQSLLGDRLMIGEESLRHLLKVAKEFLEMISVSLLIFLELRYLCQRLPHPSRRS